MSPLINTCTCTARVLQLHRFHSVSTTVTDTAPSVRHQSYKRSVWWTYLSFLHFSNDLLYINSCVCKHHQHLCHHHHQHHQHLCHHHHQHHHYPQFINSQTQRSISSIATTNLVERVKLLYLASLFLAVEQKQRHVSVSSSRHVLPASPVNKHIATSCFCFVIFTACSACFSCQQTHRNVTFLFHLLRGVFCLLLLSTNTSPRHVSASSSSRRVLPASPVNKHIAASRFCFIFFAASLVSAQINVMISKKLTTASLLERAITDFWSKKLKQ